jgi:hypothetical protein
LESSLLVSRHHLQDALLEGDNAVGIHRVISLSACLQVSAF